MLQVDVLLPVLLLVLLPAICIAIDAPKHLYNGKGFDDKVSEENTFMEVTSSGYLIDIATATNTEDSIEWTNYNESTNSAKQNITIGFGLQISNTSEGISNGWLETKPFGNDSEIQNSEERTVDSNFPPFDNSSCKSSTCVRKCCLESQILLYNFETAGCVDAGDLAKLWILPEFTDEEGTVVEVAHRVDIVTGSLDCEHGPLREDQITHLLPNGYLYVDGKVFFIDYCMEVVYIADGIKN